MTDKNPSKRKAYIGFVIFFLICFMAMIFPIYSIANRVEPIVFGMPFGMFWLVLITVLQFCGLFALYAWEYRKWR